MNEDFTFDEWVYFNLFSGDDLIGEQIAELMKIQRYYLPDYPRDFWLAIRHLWS